MPSVPVMLTHNPELVADTILGVVQIIEQDLFKTLLYLGALLGFIGMVFGYLTGNKTTSPRAYALAFIFLLMSVKLTHNMAVVDPLSGRTRVIEDVPAVIVGFAWTTSAIGAGFQNLMAQFLTSPSGSDVLSKDGVGRGLAIIQGIRNVPWTEVSRSAGGNAPKYTDLQASIENYLNKCHILAAKGSGAATEAYTQFYNRGKTGSIAEIWDRVKSDYIEYVDVKINLPSSSSPPNARLCSVAHEEIKALLISADFREKIVDDAILHLSKQIAAVSLPSAGVSAVNGVAPHDLTKMELKADAAEILNELFGSDGYGETLPKILFLEKMNTAVLSAYELDPDRLNKPQEGRLASAWTDAKKQNDLSMAAQGDWFTRNAAPMTRIIEGMVFAFIPIFLVMMFISQKGMKAFIGAAGVIMWLQTWPVAYVIINYFTTHTMIAQLSPLLDGGNMGMLDLYRLWEQAITSYAVSQSMLGMTPLITGVLLSGSMMMLTKMAGNMSSNENFDEKRVHRDVESAAPRYAPIPNQVVYSNDGSVRHTDAAFGDVKTTIGNANKSAQTEVEAKIDTLQETRGIELATAVKQAIATGDTTALNTMAAGSTEISSAIKEAISSVLSKVKEEALSETETEAVAAGLGITGKNGKDGKVEIGADLKLTDTNMQQFMQAVKSSEALQKLMGDELGQVEKFNVSDSTAHTLQTSNIGETAGSKAFKDTQAKIEQYQKTLSNLKFSESSITQNQMITDGQLAYEYDKLISELSNVAAGVNGGIHEKTSALAEHLSNKGYTDDYASILAKQIVSEQYKDKFHGADQDMYVGPNRDGLALLHTLRRMDSGSTEALSYQLHTQRDYALLRNTPKVDSDHNYKPAAGFNDPTNEAKQNTQAHRDLKPVDLSTVALPDRSEILNSTEQRKFEVESRIGKVKALTEQLRNAIADHQIVVDESGGTVSYTERVMGSESGFGDRAARAEIIDKASLQAAHALDFPAAGKLAGYSLELGQVNSDVPQGTESYIQQVAQERSRAEASENLLISIVEGLATSYAYESDATAQQRAVLESMLPLLSDEAKKQYLQKIQAAAGNQEQISTIQNDYQTKLAGLGIRIDQEWLQSMASRISGKEINSLDALEQIGNWMTNVDNDAIRQVLRELNETNLKYTQSDVAIQANADLKGIEQYNEYVQQNEETLSNYTKALFEAMLEQSVVKGEYAEMSRVQSDLENYILGKKGDNEFLAAAQGSLDGMKDAISPEVVNRFMEERGVKTSFNDYMASVPDQIREDFQAFYDEKLAEQRAKMPSGKMP